MAFWGVEVKPGKPVTHLFDRVRGRLHISQATLGIGSSTKKCLVQCNVGDKTPVFLCALFPDKTESCHLDLEFEEADEVIFSVIGPRSIYLTGYYLANGRHSNLNDDTDSYGEDIANTDESTHFSDEDEYEDSFIDDGDPEVLPPLPVSNDRALFWKLVMDVICVTQYITDEEMLDNKKPKESNGIHKRLKKKYRSIESDDDNNSQRQNIVNDCKGVSGLENEEEDYFPISSLYKSRTTEAGEKFDRSLGKTEDDGAHARTEGDGTRIIEPKSKADSVVIDGVSERGRDLPCNSSLPSEEVCLENHTKSKKKRKERTKEGQSLEADAVNHNSALKDDKALQDKAEDRKPATDKGTDRSYDSLLPSTEAGSVNDAKPKKRKKEWAAEGKSVEGRANCANVLKEDKVKQHDVGAGESGKDLSLRSEQDQKFSYYKNTDIDSNQVADGDQSEDKKTKKKKKKGKIQENENVEAKSSQARTLSNGLIIEELEMGKPDGKMAAPGKKVKVHYIGKLKETGKIFDSNIGKAPLKFRLGVEDVIEGWNFGLDGMRVGDKRRLTIPPSMGYGSQGGGENIPPNSWLVYEVELVGVR